MVSCVMLLYLTYLSLPYLSLPTLWARGTDDGRDDLCRFFLIYLFLDEEGIRRQTGPKQIAGVGMFVGLCLLTVVTEIEVQGFFRGRECQVGRWV